jgi:epoxyqueuosine reductase QueG
LLYTQNNVIANGILNTITFHVANYITYAGYRAVPIISSQAQVMTEEMGDISPADIDWEPLTSSSLPAKAAGSAAGLGWIGKNMLLINPEIGPRFRLATVITDMPLDHGSPMESRCGDCEECVKSCPVDAIRGVQFSGIPPPPREEILDFPKCRNRLWLENCRLKLIGYPVCGICLAACPFGMEEP